jgi:uncharacterized protein
VTGDGPPRLAVSVADIRRHLGSRFPIRLALVAQGLTVGNAAVVESGEVVVDGELESIPDGVVLTGEVSVPWTGACRRCLDTIAGTASVDVREVYEIHPTDGETWPLTNDQVDLGPLLHDIALIALPLAPLCGDDCRGPAPEEFPAGVAPPVTDDGGEHGRRDDDHAEPPRDPRWAALDDLDL